MLFNSFEFAFFLPIVFILYWFVCNKNLKLQNLLLLVASYIFYGQWDCRFLLLIAFSSLLDYLVGRGLSIYQTPRKRKGLLILSLCSNLGLFGFLKYYNFFIESFRDAFLFFGRPIDISTIDIILPVGISFYTFQTLSYTIDVYNGKIKANKEPITFFAFVSFFPQLVAGPIERATNLLPQFKRPRIFNEAKAIDGLRQILWGLFKKIVIADNCAVFANEIFNNSADYGGSTLALGALFFTFQIYGDFSGYSDIAIGVSRLFGFNLMKNFAFPYFSRDIAEFWRRWHISLSTWFRDYLYIPLGGSRGGTALKIRNTFIIFLVSGFWHGANWTFIVWGGLNALYFLPLLLSNNNRNHLNDVAEGRLLPTFRELWAMGTTFTLTVLAWIFFRANNLSHAIAYLQELFSSSLFTFPNLINEKNFLHITLLLIFFLILEWGGRSNEYGIEKTFLKKSQYYRWIFYALLIFLLGMYGQTEETPFIYFQF